ncbi:PIN domain-containing protein [Agromyces albus]|uniref:Ribonuclease VapC n=1 Tax=Agromyces albus TaxID=205332 RepID=A0A4Q2KS66_9MICO|nr:PIN domain-containing protein [Agromyces albus]RXZ68294.1 type II toxin-antitoxin system VapC family toxin [Agromyces albus]
MARRLILDTGVLIASERQRRDFSAIVAPDDDLVIAAITLAELRTGVELATPQHRARRAEFLVRVLETLPVEPYDLATAEAHGRLLAHVTRSGTKRGTHDLIIAATAVATKRIVLTTHHAARFDELPGVDCIVV